MDPANSAPSTSTAPPPASDSTTFQLPDPSQQHQQQQQHGAQLPSPGPVSPGYPPAGAPSSSQHPDQPSSAAASSSSTNNLPQPFAAAGTAPPPPPVPSTAGAPPSTSATRAPPPIISYDPNAASDDDDDEDGGAAPKKKRKAAGGRAAAASGGGGGNASASGSQSGAADQPEKGRRKIEIEYIQKKEKRHITFSKRKAGIMKKAYELATLTGTEVLLLVVSETGIVYTFTTTKFQPLVGAAENGQPSEGQRLIQQCLAVPADDDKSDYISPPPDGPLLPLPPSAQKRPFEANSPIHGGQIALRTKQHRPRNKRPAPIVPPGPGSGGSLPTPGIHAQMDQMNNLPMSPHQLHPLNPAPPGSIRDYPPSPGFPPPPPGMPRPSELPSPMHPSQEYQEMMDRAQMNGQYGPPAQYPPPPALGYTHQLPNPPGSAGRPPHPLDPYPPPPPPPGHSGSPNSSPRRQHLPPPPPHHAQYQPAAPRTLGGPPGPDPYAIDHQQRGGPYGGEDTRMLSPFQQHAQPPGPGGPGGPAGGGGGLPNPPPEMYMQHGQLPNPPGGAHPSPRQAHAQPMYHGGDCGGDAYMRTSSVVIELYDHSAPSRSSSQSPLVPSTPTRLPSLLDEQLQRVQHRLVLPPTSTPFWSTRLPPTRKLDTRTPSTLSAAGFPSSAAPQPSPPAEQRPRIWSESFGLPSPPSIPTASLWTPSKSLDSPSSSAALKQEAVLDFRFGPLAIDWIDHPQPRSMPSPVLAARPPPPSSSSSGAALPSPPLAHTRPPETSGTTDLYFGTIHLYREAGAEESSSREEKQRARDEDDGRSVGLVSVPGVLNAAAVLAFIAPALESVEQVRMLRDATPNRSLVLIRFRDASTAAEFKRMYNGKPYHDSKDSEICHVVSLSSIKLKSTSTPPFTFPYTPSDLASPASPLSSPSAVELPTCPVCLEVLDTRVSGLVQIMCQHSYHCSCLLKWGDSRCPVCRSTNRARRNTLTSSSTAAGQAAADSKCAVCQSPSNLWICVICGNVGCGRYQGGHAHSHFTETGHSYSLEIETGRIWSYFDDEYVHRLIRLRPNGADPTSPSSSRLLELPSLSSTSRSSVAAATDPDDLSAKIAQQAGGPNREAEVEQDKLEALALEYGNLMSSQLADQREYYDDELARVKDLQRLSEAKREELERALEVARREAVEREKREKKDREGWEKDRRGLEERLAVLDKEARREADERKKERAEALKARKTLEKELEAERAVTASLSSNLAALRSDLAAQKAETARVGGEVDELKDQLNDLMAALSMRERIEQEGEGSEWAGASIGVAPAPGMSAEEQREKRNPSAAKAAARRKKKK
ncbi:hypothetical protein JCM8097_004959 [Rhodosporidiobolus ruineniae]